MKLLVTSTAPFEFDPPEGVDVVYVDPGELVPPEHLDADAAARERAAGRSAALAALAHRHTDGRSAKRVAKHLAELTLRA